MPSFHWCHHVGILVALVGCMTVSSVHQDKNAKEVFPDSRSVTVTVPHTAIKTAGQAAYSKRPVRFEVNQGQSDAQVQFLSRGHGTRLFLSPTEALVTMQPAKANGKLRTRKMAIRGQAAEAQTPAVMHHAPATRLRMQLVGANPYAVVSGIDALPGRVNYISGQDAAQWHTHTFTSTPLLPS
jgi:hypothetical protein